MNLLTDSPVKLYKSYLFSSLFAALAMTIYAFVDTIAIGQAEGPIGTAAMAVITPVYGAGSFLSALCGIGGSVLMSVSKGAGEEEKGNACFTAAILVEAATVIAAWLGLFLFHDQLFYFLGANEALMPKIMEYAKWIILFFPVFSVPAFISAFLRNDDAPRLAMAAVVCGGCVNMLGDWFFVFPLKMGMEGAAIATILGSLVQVLIMCSHFLSKKCRLRLVRPRHMVKGIRKIVIGGFGAGIVDFGTVVITILMNKQIMKYGGETELAVYGVLVTIYALFQALFCGVGQALQPLESVNYGSGNLPRIKEFWRLSVVTVLLLGVVFTGIGLLFPTQIVSLFVKATPEVLSITPAICRPFFLVFLPLGFSVLSIYHLQSIQRDKAALMIAVSRSIVVSGLLIILLPLAMGLSGVWIALPLAELLVVTAALVYIGRFSDAAKWNKNAV